MLKHLFLVVKVFFWLYLYKFNIINLKSSVEASYPDGEWSGNINFRANDVQNQLNDLTVGLQGKKKEDEVTIVIPPIREEEMDEIQK